MDSSIKTTDVAIIVATLLGPILAVQAQVFLEREREQHRRRLQVFMTLMSERLNLSPAHIAALNAVPLEFSAKKGRVGEIRTAWKVYINHMGRDVDDPTWQPERVKLFLDMLGKMAAFLRYQLDPVELEREFYAPRRLAAVFADEEAIRTGLAAVLRGDASLPLAVRSMPMDPEVAALWKRTLTKLDAWLDRQKAVAPPGSRALTLSGTRSPGRRPGRAGSGGRLSPASTATMAPHESAGAGPFIARPPGRCPAG